ncbi:hypothetical protein ABH922_005565 [Rhodococcus sp. 27YEA15]|uniref:hypothetical protein n=1 Tax=Rhodococcus sp. 27YEA15 TaxID=3156259 RepID=UPI003C79D35A
MTTHLARFVLDDNPDMFWENRTPVIEDLHVVLARVPRFDSGITLDGVAQHGSLAVFGDYSMHHLVLRDRTVSLITDYPRRSALTLRSM